MNVNALFTCLIKKLDVDCVCDIGSMDGTQSILFRNALPGAEIFAFEANPANYNSMANDADIKSHGIKVVQGAVANSSRKVNFYLEEHRGKGSLLEKDNAVKETVEVDSLRIDDFISGSGRGFRNIALWVDVESAGFEVIEGMEGIKDLVSVIHMELETRHIRKKQKLKDDVASMLASYGFTEVATAQPVKGKPQFNTVFINKNHLRDNGYGLAVCKTKASLVDVFALQKLAYRLLGRGAYRKLKMKCSRYL
jgi:FkbM family methyltransferase